MDNVEDRGWERIAFAQAVAIGAGERERIAVTIGLLIGELEHSPLSRFGQPGGYAAAGATGGLELSRCDALGCCSELLRESDAAMARGEFVVAYALLGIEGRLLEELIGVGTVAG